MLTHSYLFLISQEYVSVQCCLCAVTLIQVLETDHPIDPLIDFYDSHSCIDDNLTFEQGPQ